MMTRLFALSLLVVLATACDSADDGDAPGFQATIGVDTAEPRLVRGSAAVGDELTGQFRAFVDPELEGATLTAVLLTASGEDVQFLLAGLTEGALTAGTYAIDDLGGGPSGSSFLFLSLEGDPRDPEALAIGAGDSGTVTIETASADRLAGTFSVRVVDLSDPTGDDDPITVEGRFTAAGGLGD